MAKTEIRLSGVIEKFLGFTEEKLRFQHALHEFHDVAMHLERALKGKSIKVIAFEERTYAAQEKKVQTQAGHFDRSLYEYQQALLSAKRLLKKSSLVTFRGKKYKITPRRDQVEIILSA